MKILALESSAKAASCAVLSDGELLASAWQATGLTHSRTLLPMVEDMLNNSELSVQEIDAVAVAAGPGSFTGLRIGIAAVKGLAWAAEKPCIPVSTLEAMAWPLAHLEGNIVCAMDARRQQIYNAVFLAEGGELTRLREDRAVSLEEAAADVGEMDGPMTIVGDGAGLCFDFLTARGLFPGTEHLLPSGPGPSAAAERRGRGHGRVAAERGEPVRSGADARVPPPEPGGAGASCKR